MKEDNSTGSPPKPLPKAWQTPPETASPGKGASHGRETNDYYAASTATTPLGMPIVRKDKAQVQASEPEEKSAPANGGPEPGRVEPSGSGPETGRAEPSANVHESRHADEPDGGTEQGPAEPKGATDGPRKRCPACGDRFPADFRVCPRDAVVLEDVEDEGDDPLVGKVLGDCYRIVRKIGLGGTAKVFEARHTRLRNKRFAVKLLLPEFAVQPDIVKRFEREAESASLIRHPNVVDVYDVHRTDDGKPYLVAEFLEGEELGDTLDRDGRLQPLLAAQIGLQICDALAAAHAHGIVHRDMKPENVYLMGDQANPTAKVIDFGISKVAYETGSKKLTKTGMVMGTPCYMPPEQAMGKKVDHRADVYGVGAILYRALTGRRPFEESDAMSILSAVIRSNPPRPRSVQPSVPEALELIVERAMAKQPDDRYPTIAALRADLEEFVQVETAKAARGGAPGAATVTAAGAPKVRDPSLPPFLPHLADKGGESTLAQAARQARVARPTILFLSILAFLWGLTGIVEVIHAVLRKIGFSYSPMEMWLGLGVLLAAALTPGVFWIRYLARDVWVHSNRALRLAHGMRRVVGVGVAAYGSALLLVRLLSLIRAPDPPGGPFNWPVTPFAVSLLAAGVSFLTLWMHDRRSRKERLAAARTAAGAGADAKARADTDPAPLAMTRQARSASTRVMPRGDEAPPPPPHGGRDKGD